MQKTFRSFAITAVFLLSVATMLPAETMGTNPKPRPAPTKFTIFETIQSFVFMYMGI